MKPALQTEHATIYQGDCLSVLKEMKGGSVHCIVTSPPYWGLRDYGTGEWEGGDAGCDHIAPPSGVRQKGVLLVGSGNRDGFSSDGQFKHVCRRCGARRLDKQLGLEKLHDCLALLRGKEPCGECYVCKVVLICRELRRVLRKDGTFFLNLGDSYCNSGSNKNGEGLDGKRRGGATGPDGETGYKKRDIRYSLSSVGLKIKDLCGVPWRTALALQADGWTLRSDIPWVRRNSMPESCTDRPAKSLEYVFLFSRGQRYYFDMESVRKPLLPGSADRYAYSFGGAKNQALVDANKDGVGRRTSIVGNRTADVDRNFRNSDLWFQSVDAPHGLTGVDDELVGLDVTTKGYAGAHFAVFPSALILPLILAGTSQKGCCPKCGVPWQRIVERDRQPTRPAKESKLGSTTIMEHGNRDPQRHCTTTKTKGWEPGCGCGGDPVPCTVLDPFMGSGTTAAVAVKNGRRAIGIELNEKYIELIARRLKKAEGDRGFGF